MPARITSSASGKLPQGAGGRSSGAATGVPASTAASLLALLPSCSTAASRPANGHPEETLTRHQPISIPIGPRRGRECQWPQPGTPRSSRLIRTHLKSAGAASIWRSSSRLRGLDPGLLAQGQPRLGDPVGELVAQPLQLAEVEDPRLGARARRRGEPTSTRPKPSAKSAASSRSRRPIWRRSSARARRSSTSTRSADRSSLLRVRSGIGLASECRSPAERRRAPSIAPPRPRSAAPP